MILTRFVDLRSLLYIWNTQATPEKISRQARYTTVLELDSFAYSILKEQVIQATCYAASYGISVTAMPQL